MRLGSTTLSVTQPGRRRRPAAAGGGASRNLSQYQVLNLNALDPNSWSGSGSTWSDLSSAGNDGNLTGPTYNFSTVPNFDFDGVNDRVTFSQAQNLGNEVTFSFWVRPTLNYSINTLIGNKGSAASTGYSFNINTWNTGDRKLIWEVADGSVGTTFASASNVVDNNLWQNLAVTCVRSTGAVVLYKNGSQVASGTVSVTGWNNSSIWMIGRFPPVSAYYYHGRMAIAQAWTVALTPTEMTDQWNVIRPNFGL